MMDFINFILERIFVVVFSFLVLIGVSPDIYTPTIKNSNQENNSQTNEIKNYYDEVNKQQNNNSNNQNPTPTQKEENNISKIVDDAQKIVEDSFELKNQEEIKDAVVNIICTNKKNNSIEVHTGSGVIIDPRGVVITNAHVAQYFLLETKNNPDYMNCNLYKSDLPTFGYKAKILFISPSWIEKNYSLIRDENPMGTGEGDYAFLYITENINKNIEKPKEFTYAKFDLNHDYKKGDKVFTAGYPGSPTSTKNLSASSKLISEETKIYDVFTLNSNSIDIFSTEINKVAQKGSSGGGVFKSDRLIGLIVTITKNNAGNKINALTTEYINRNLISKEGFSVESLLKGDYITANLDIKVKEFYDTNFEKLRSLLLKVY